MKDKADKYAVIATKVAPEVKQQLRRILRKMGMNEYQWFQAMAEVTVRMMDDQHNLTEAMAKMIQMFRLVPGFKDPVTFADPKCEGKIREAVYIISTKERQGSKPVMVQEGWWDGVWQETQNVKDIVERIIEVCMPDSYRRLREYMVELDCTSVFECLMTMVDERELVHMEDEVPQMWDEFAGYHCGRKVEYGKRTKRKHHITPDTMRKPKEDDHETQ